MRKIKLLKIEKEKLYRLKKEYNKISEEYWKSKRENKESKVLNKKFWKILYDKNEYTKKLAWKYDTTDNAILRIINDLI